MNRIDIRATQLETYRTCPYKFKFEPKSDPKSEHFLFGSLLHKYIELTVMWQLNDDIRDILLSRLPVKQRYMIIKMANIFVEHLENKWYTFIAAELTNNNYYEDIDIYLEWTLDLLFRDNEWSLVVVDIKTAKSKRNEEHIEWVRQKLIYPVLCKKNLWIDISRFEYWIMTKTSNPDLQEVIFDVPENAEEQVDNKLVELRQAETQGLRPTNYPNFSCRYCPLRSSCKGYQPIT